MSRDKTPQSPLDQYRIYRGLSKTDLAKKTGLPKATIDAACFATRIPKKKTLERIADALHVDVSDLNYDPSLEDPLRDVYDIPQAVEDIKKAISVHDPWRIQKEASQIIAYLEFDDRKPDSDQVNSSNRTNKAASPRRREPDEMTPLETAVEHVLKDINMPGISLILYSLQDRRKEIPASSLAFTKEISPSRVLDFYMKQRDLQVKQMTAHLKVSKPTLLKLRLNSKLLTKEQLQQLTVLLHVDTSDLVPDCASPEGSCRVVDIYSAVKAIEDAVARCKPSLLRVRIPQILDYLNLSHSNADGTILSLASIGDDLRNLMAYLLTPVSPRQREDTINCIEAIYNYKGSHSMVPIAEDGSWPKFLGSRESFRRDHTPFVYVGYSPSDCEENMYYAHIIFEDWVYSTFGLHYPLDDIGSPIDDGYDRELKQCLDLPIDISTELHPGEDDFEPELLEQIENYCHNEMGDEIDSPVLLEIFRDYVTNEAWPRGEITVEECQSRVLDLDRPPRLRTRREQYRCFIEHLFPSSPDPVFVKTMADYISWLKEDPEYERQKFEALGLEPPV